MGPEGEYLQKANEYLSTAHYLLTVTYPIIDNPRFFLSVLDHLFLGLTNLMAAFLSSETMEADVHSFEDTFESKFALFKEIAPKYLERSEEHIQLLQEIKDLIVAHRKSPVEFTRDNSFIICMEDYSTRKITEEEIKKYISRARLFFLDIDEITSAQKSV
ncbi:hypothetical protein J4460_06985 [Candidatus Woesearchaeota archaeon]|nr:MAG: hypothetical protein QS99_C0018G0047 [archaeon GW2011_AR4]MBS3130384.1 hypothetical protein [Candidatus Woesearchaeota archaeon]HIH38249.1 hypothetical protein [Candidatus Woesearchaeota archaeon]HIH49096.1 hypothetical protein [Candidatus Woesearchaeota archaeon]HIJ04165.1 hypothetical protein [Candidatus Woesearchaeota archaeon]